MSRLTRLLTFIIVLGGTAAAPAEQSADAFINQFVADVHARRVDAVRDRLFLAEGRHPEAGKRQTESILEAVRGGVLGLRVLEVRADGDAAAAAVTELRIEGRQ